MQPDLVDSNQPEKREWTFFATDRLGLHGSILTFDCKFTEGKFVEGMLWAGPF